MTRTARRRWTREMATEVDGIALGGSGPVLLHGYEPPAGGKWVDSVIPGKLSALDRQSGEVLWSSPCEVGYGRGFGAGLGGENDVLVLGPSLQGHRIVRMALETGELLDLKPIEPFDMALVFPDMCVCVTPTRVFGVLTDQLVEAWDFSKSGQRFHWIGRAGKKVFVVHSDPKTKQQGVLCLNVDTGRPSGALLEPCPTMIHAIAAQPGSVALVVENLAEVLSRDALMEHLMARIEEDPDGEVDTPTGLALLALSPERGSERPLWFDGLTSGDADDLPEVTICADQGKLYIAQRALLDVRDALTGRRLGQVTIPGLDEHVAWKVAQGGGLLAEETRASIFEIPD